MSGNGAVKQESLSNVKEAFTTVATFLESLEKVCGEIRTAILNTEKGIATFREHLVDATAKFEADLVEARKASDILDWTKEGYL